MKWAWVLICIVAGLVLLICGLLIPAHLRAVDASLLETATNGKPTLLEDGRTLAMEKNLGAAQMMVAAARVAAIPGWDRLGATVTNLAQQNPGALFWGDDARVENLFGNNFNPPPQNAQAFSGFIVQQKNLKAALAPLENSKNSAVQELLRSRSLNHTVLFPPPQSAAGQAFDTAVSICGLLMDGNHLTTNLSGNILALAAAANHGGGSEPLEQTLMDFMSLGERFNWDQLTAFVAKIQNAGTLHLLADEARNAGEKLPVLFAAVQLSGKPANVAQYVANFNETGLPDLGASLHYGAGGVNELAKSGKRFYDPKVEQRVTEFNPFGSFFYSAAKFSFWNPPLALAVKWFCYWLAGFFFAGALHCARPAESPLERPLQVRGFYLFREILFSVGFLLVVLLLSEPFLAQENQRENFSLLPRLPMAGDAVAAGIAGLKQTVKPNIMNPTIILTLLIFFVLQALIYIACLVKLAEIRRQNIPPRMKLKLLENEDHLFDAGLYLGFVGTIISLIVASLGLVKFSLMAAYSSTSFGIIFVVIFKIFHLRPARRKLLLEAEAQNMSEIYVPIATPAPNLPS